MLYNLRRWGAIMKVAVVAKIIIVVRVGAAWL